MLTVFYLALSLYLGGILLYGWRRALSELVPYDIVSGMAPVLAAFERLGSITDEVGRSITEVNSFIDDAIAESVSELSQLELNEYVSRTHAGEGKLDVLADLERRRSQL